MRILMLAGFTLLIGSLVSPAFALKCDQTYLEQRVKCLDELVGKIPEAPELTMRAEFKDCLGANPCQNECKDGEFLASAVCFSDGGSTPIIRDPNKVRCTPNLGVRGVNIICAREVRPPRSRK